MENIPWTFFEMIPVTEGFKVSGLRQTVKFGFDPLAGSLCFFLCYPFYSKLSTLRIGKTRRHMNLLQGRQV